LAASIPERSFYPQTGLKIHFYNKIYKYEFCPYVNEYRRDRGIKDYLYKNAGKEAILKPNLKIFKNPKGILVKMFAAVCLMYVF
jgi:hypothetical protein